MDSLAVQADEGKEFHLSNGRVLKNLYELSNALKGMDEETFSHHVNNERNDFANWIRHVFLDDKLADEIESSLSKERIAHHLSQRLSHPTVGELPLAPKASEPPVPAKDKSNTIQKNKRKKLTKIFSRKEDDAQDLDDSVPPDLKSAEPAENRHMHEELLKRLDEVLAREREIDFREKKIQEIEENIESQLKDIKVQNQTEVTFFSKEFVQGLVAGFLITLILALLYLKFMP